MMLMCIRVAVMRLLPRVSASPVVSPLQRTHPPGRLISVRKVMPHEVDSLITYGTSGDRGRCMPVGNKKGRTPKTKQGPEKRKTMFPPLSAISAINVLSSLKLAKA